MSIKYVDIIIIGSGMAGLYSAYNIKKTSPNTSFLVLEKYKKYWIGGRTSNEIFYGTEIVTGAGIGRKGKDKMLYKLLDNLNFRVVVLMSDGECNEGSVWEAIMFAGHHKLNNLLVIVDYNKIQSLGHTKDILDLEPFVDKWKAFRWNVKEIDGHNMDEIYNAVSVRSEMPTVIIAHTIKGKGVSFMEDTVLWHYRTPKGDELKEALIEIKNQSII